MSLARAHCDAPQGTTTRHLVSRPPQQPVETRPVPCLESSRGVDGKPATVVPLKHVMRLAPLQAAAPDECPQHPPAGLDLGDIDTRSGQLGRFVKAKGTRGMKRRTREISQYAQQYSIWAPCAPPNDHTFIHKSASCRHSGMDCRNPGARKALRPPHPCVLGSAIPWRNDEMCITACPNDCASQGEVDLRKRARLNSKSGLSVLDYERRRY